ncbi:imidazole glycerol phosphate synthase subunit HisF [Trichlorobacter lovleyi]|uniref:imidazole glycerol-phosphate synthase n=1 Tax=Trichlorobacter lovleyi (strain ATCC BAA-1151 / DSM 17278 / SZ) TaxID=398767 RepID=B3E201_TRIL1|nr:imidazole glycerol phosphate synthase cyclase subunit [Trichlorobacter lovleyi]ACD97104.1 histidine biosynthesis protein [Trichlorobacter lovleyi SZ]
MKPVRIIPRLDIKGPNLVKGIHLEGLRVLGDPIAFAHYYYENGADELIYSDIVASLYQRNSILDLVTETSRSVFIPITLAGGLRTLNDIQKALRAGADKVCINTAAIENPDFIAQAVRVFGSSTIVVAVEVVRNDDNSLIAYTENGRQSSGIEAVSWVQRVEELGAGEILLTSINAEGTGDGYDMDLINRVVSAVSIPVIAHGGAGKPEHVREVFATSDVRAAAVASMFHYYAKKLSADMNPVEGNLDFLRSGKSFSRVSEISIVELKQYLSKHGIVCRLVN